MMVFHDNDNRNNEQQLSAGRGRFIVSENAITGKKSKIWDSSDRNLSLLPWRDGFYSVFVGLQKVNYEHHHGEDE